MCMKWSTAPSSGTGLVGEPVSAAGVSAAGSSAAGSCASGAAVASAEGSSAGASVLVVHAVKAKTRTNTISRETIFFVMKYSSFVFC